MAMPTEEKVSCGSGHYVSKRFMESRSCTTEHDGFIGNCPNVCVVEEAY